MKTPVQRNFFFQSARSRKGKRNTTENGIFAEIRINLQNYRRPSRDGNLAGTWKWKTFDNRFDAVFPKPVLNDGLRQKFLPRKNTPEVIQKAELYPEKIG